MNIRQLSASYLEDQDRILLSINTSEADEFQVWLTRRLTLRLWPLLNRVVVDHFAIPTDAHTDGYVDLAALDTHTRHLLANSRKEETLIKADFATPYDGGDKKRPLGSTPLLITEINLTPDNQGHLQVKFSEELASNPTPRGFKLDLQDQLVFGLLQLVGQALEKSGWQTVERNVAVADDEAEAEEFDLSMPDTAPKYLN